ncbi:MAG: TIGR04206 family protein [Halobacteriales archaeon]
MRRPLAILALAAVPWVVVPVGGHLSLLFPWGMATLEPLSTTPLWRYLEYTSGLPRRLRAWPASTFLWTIALAYAMVGSIRPSLEDCRVTGALLVLSGASSLIVVVGLVRGGTPALPVGTVAVWAVAWWFHWPDLRAAFGR